MKKGVHTPYSASQFSLQVVSLENFIRCFIYKHPIGDIDFQTQELINHTVDTSYDKYRKTLTTKCFCPCANVIKPWRNQNSMSDIVGHSNITHDCKNKEVFNNPGQFFQHVYAFKGIFLLHYAIFESLLKMYPKIVNLLIPASEKKKNLLKNKIPVSFLINYY